MSILCGFLFFLASYEIISHKKLYIKLETFYNICVWVFLVIWSYLMLLFIFAFIMLFVTQRTDDTIILVVAWSLKEFLPIVFTTGMLSNTDFWREKNA